MRQLKKAQDVISREKQGDLVGDTDDVIISRLRSELANAQQNLKKYAESWKKIQHPWEINRRWKNMKLKSLNEKLSLNKINEDRMKKNSNKLTILCDRLEETANKSVQENKDLSDTISKHNETDRITKSKMDDKTKQVDDLNKTVVALQSQIDELKRGFTSDERELYRKSGS